MKSSLFCSVALGILLSASCAGNDEVVVKEAETVSLCEIQNNIQPMGSLFSFDMVNDSTFVVSDMNIVMLYDISGRQIRLIGHTGRAEFEYNMPLKVKVCNDVIYVWSAMTLKFVAYALDGTPVAEYKYNSAISDFLPTEEYIFIYTAGKSFDNIIDLYDKSKGTVVKSIGQSSEEHKLLLHNMAVSPMAFQDGKLFFASKDKLDIMMYDVAADELSEFTHIDSPTFSVEALADYSSVAMDRSKRSQYLWTNSMTLMLNPRQGGMELLTMEGKSEMVEDVMNTEKRFLGKYSFGKGLRNHSDYYFYHCFETQSLFDAHDGGIYFISHSIQDSDDVYKLEKIVM